MKPLEIFGKKYRVVRKNLEKEKLCGYIDFEKNKIFIHNSMNEKDNLETILHEAFHGINERLSFNIAGITPEFEEILVDTYAKFIVENLQVILELSVGKTVKEV